ncbi:hypothetical protein GQ43DRAFT_129768 [Delitschia confertaspora ATCC 74209]|uniref:Uncharacterized protein n=1 Tax=Delitschia confertaspora ATCC 74209 TaxID=1513339 RepID=A0A9P4JMD8_9PLEO|nr:hypothetical protein GQ43DRAFT_129768 [Delitschia confertaspora ATCC 74209]
MSIVRKTFADHIPEWISRVTKGEENWDTCRITLEGHSHAVTAISSRQIASWSCLHPLTRQCGSGIQQRGHVAARSRAILTPSTL